MICKTKIFIDKSTNKDTRKNDKKGIKIIIKTRLQQ